MQFAELFQEGFVEVEQVVVFDNIRYSRNFLLNIIEFTDARIIDERALRKRSGK